MGKLLLRQINDLVVYYCNLVYCSNAITNDTVPKSAVSLCTVAGSQGPNPNGVHVSVFSKFLIHETTSKQN